MSESTLSTPRSEILQAVGAFFDYGRDQYQWTREQREQVYRCVRSGERQFYAPPNHSWSFLRLRMTIAVVNGTSDYTLADGFGGFFDPYLSFAAADNQLFPVRQTSVQEILRMRSLSNLVTTIQPEFYAVNPQAPTGSTGQRFEVLLFPTPIADGTLSGNYYASPDATTDALPYALGGEIHSETLLSCCLAAAELERDKQAGPMKQQYNERLAASIQHDKRTGVKNFGYNSDPGSSRAVSLHDFRSVNSNVNYNGSPLSSY